MDFPCGRKGAGGSEGVGGWDGDLLPLLSPGKHPSGMLLSGAGNTITTPFKDKFLSVI